MTGMTPERLAEIRVRADMPRLGLSLAREMDKDVLAIRDLVAEVTSLWAQRDGTGDVASGTLWRAEREVSRLNNELGAQLTLRREVAQQIEKVRALHQPWDDGPQPYCTHDREPWPCPTEQALGAR